jgi:hypothetical protein
MRAVAVDWFEWHRVYANPSSRASLRLVAVQRAIRQAIDELPPGAFHVLSLCSGQGHDIIGVLADHARRADADVTFVDADPRNIEHALTRAGEAGIDHVHGVVGDAGLSDSVAGVPRASLLLLVGMVAHLRPSDFVQLIGALPQICDEGAIVVWNRRPGAATAWSLRSARRAYRDAGFVDAGFTLPTSEVSRVSAERFVGVPAPLVPGRRWFTFVATPRRPSRVRRLKVRAARVIRFRR